MDNHGSTQSRPGLRGVALRCGRTGDMQSEACNCSCRKRIVWLRMPAFWSVMRADRSEVERELSAEHGAVYNSVPRETAIGVILAERPVSAE